MKIAIGILVALVVIAGGYFLIVHKTEVPATSAETPTPTATTNTTTSGTTHTGTATKITGTTNTGAPSGSTLTGPAHAAVTVNYTSKGFSPKVITIVKDTTVNFVNNSDTTMWVASNPHPTNNGYSGTTVSQHCPNSANNSFDECTAVGRGNTYTFTFLKVGTWGYHNHMDSSSAGTVVVLQ